MKALLEEEFEPDYERLRQSGVLTYEVMNLITVCTSVFKTLGFSDDKENTRNLRYALTGTIQEYLNSTRL